MQRRVEVARREREGPPEVRERLRAPLGVLEDDAFQEVAVRIAGLALEEQIGPFLGLRVALRVDQAAREPVHRAAASGIERENLLDLRRPLLERHLVVAQVERVHG